ncbi:unnamed protein product, partial [marine sediment metagenome]
MAFNKPKNKIMTFNELEERVHLWALDKGLITEDNLKQQALKTVEEVG